METRNYAVGRRERRRLSNYPDIIYQSEDGSKQVRIAFKGSPAFADIGDILTHTFVRDRSGNLVPNGEFARFPDTPRNRDRIFGYAATKGCFKRLLRAEVNEQS